MLTALGVYKKGTGQASSVVTRIRALETDGERNARETGEHIRTLTLQWKEQLKQPAIPQVEQYDKRTRDCASRTGKQEMLTSSVPSKLRSATELQIKAARTSPQTLSDDLISVMTKAESNSDGEARA